MAHESIVNLTAENFDAEVKNATVPVLVDFWAEWCGPCKMLGPVLDQIAEEKGDSIKICKVELEGDNQALAAQYNVRSIPALLYFRDGELKEQGAGVVPKDTIVEKLDALA
ncbi:MAG: thioredoxin [Verrucomicrobiales bacterium]|nr:thioredoxin [Verrucomicrobiales bacterium]